MSDIIRLRPATIGDIDDEYCAWYDGSDGHLDYFTGSGRKFTRATLEADFLRGVESESWFYFVAEHEADARRIGTVKIGPIDKKNRTADMVCLIGNRAYVGKGLASRMIAQAITIAFESFGIRRLHSGMYATNVSSIKAYTRAGWQIEAEMKGYYLVDGAPVDRVCVCCLNPKFFPPSNS